jgi:hypothetical protein
MAAAPKKPDGRRGAFYYRCRALYALKYQA